MGTDATGFPLGDLRASDAERDWPPSELSEACQFSRITADELDPRSTQALSVRTGEKLTAPRRPVGYLVSRLTIGAFQTSRPLQGPGGGCMGDDVRASRANPASRRGTCVAGDHPWRTHRVDHPSTGRQAAVDRILLWNRHDRCRDLACSTVARQCRIRYRLCRVRWLRRQFRVTFRIRLLPLSGCGYYIPATAGIDTS